MWQHIDYEIVALLQLNDQSLAHHRFGQEQQTLCCQAPCPASELFARHPVFLPASHQQELKGENMLSPKDGTGGVGFRVSLLYAESDASRCCWHVGETRVVSFNLGHSTSCVHTPKYKCQADDLFLCTWQTNMCMHHCRCIRYANRSTITHACKQTPASVWC